MVALTDPCYKLVGRGERGYLCWSIGAEAEVPPPAQCPASPTPSPVYRKITEAVRQTARELALSLGR
jgi:hypothetical protein